ncbi:coiled-coil domain-containing protein [Reinekea forsetii]|jgi:hypothetical protein|uniref:Uncharacterized protein n=1 Tax=Reinekea forsetii TaxID=1336806 RepID=A0A2K8KNP9_9GAMM|nr:hypothetical protein [Reinekea forsetii]ATX76282.1 hypothetical protein REIFOR_01134 [Reinekea forsetii]
MKKLILGLVSLILLSTGVLAANGSSPNGRPFIELRNQIIAVLADLNALETQHLALVQRVDDLGLDLQGQIDALNVEMLTLQAKDSEMQGSLVELVENMADQGLEIDELLTDLSDVNLAIIDMSNTMGDNSAAIEVLEAEKNAILADMAQMDESLVTALTDIALNSALIEVLAEDIAELDARKQNDVVGVCPAGTSVSTVLDNGNLMCSVSNDVGTVIANTVYGNYLDMDNSVTSHTYCSVSVLGICVSYGTSYSYHYATKYDYVSCPAGFALSGGGFWATDYEPLQVSASIPSGNRWYGRFKNFYAGNTNGLGARVYAQCIRVAP